MAAAANRRPTADGTPAFLKASPSGTPGRHFPDRLSYVESTTAAPSDPHHGDRRLQAISRAVGLEERVKRKMRQQRLNELLVKTRSINSLTPAEVERARLTFEGILLQKRGAVEDKVWQIRTLLHKLEVEVPSESEIMSLLKTFDNTKSETLDFQVAIEMLDYLKKKYTKGINEDDFDMDVCNVFSAFGGIPNQRGEELAVSDFRRITKELFESVDLDYFMETCGLKDSDGLTLDLLYDLLGKREKEIAEAFVALGGSADLEGEIPVQNLVEKIQVFNVSAPALRKFLEGLDTDGNGGLDFEEFTKMVEANDMTFSSRLKKEYQKKVTQRRGAASGPKQTTTIQFNNNTAAPNPPSPSKSPKMPLWPKSESQLDTPNEYGESSDSEGSPRTPLNTSRSTKRNIRDKIADVIASQVPVETVDETVGRIIVNNQYGRTVIVNPDKLRQQLSKVVTRHSRKMLQKMRDYRSKVVDNSLQHLFDEDIFRLEQAASDAEHEEHIVNREMERSSNPESGGSLRTTGLGSLDDDWKSESVRLLELKSNSPKVSVQRENAQPSRGKRKRSKEEKKPVASVPKVYERLNELFDVARGRVIIPDSLLRSPAGRVETPEPNSNAEFSSPMEPASEASRATERVQESPKRRGRDWCKALDSSSANYRGGSLSSSGASTPRTATGLGTSVTGPFASVVGARYHGIPSAVREQTGTKVSSPRRSKRIEKASRLALQCLQVHGDAEKVAALRNERALRRNEELETYKQELCLAELSKHVTEVRQLLQDPPSTGASRQPSPRRAVPKRQPSARPVPPEPSADDWDHLDLPEWGCELVSDISLTPTPRPPQRSNRQPRRRPPIETLDTLAFKKQHPILRNKSVKATPATKAPRPGNVAKTARTHERLHAVTVVGDGCESEDSEFTFAEGHAPIEQLLLIQRGEMELAQQSGAVRSVPEADFDPTPPSEAIMRGPKYRTVLSRKGIATLPEHHDLERPHTAR